MALVMHVRISKNLETIPMLLRYLIGFGAIEEWLFSERSPQFNVVVDSTRSQYCVNNQRLDMRLFARQSNTRIERMRLQAIDHMMVALHYHYQLPTITTPNEDVTAIRAAHHVVVAPKSGLFYLNQRPDIRQ